MIAFVEGTLVEKSPTRIVVEVGGIGYELLVPLSSYDFLPSPGSHCRLLTHDYVREDMHVLFGFATPAERDLFTLLLGISGIGPRLALGALSGLSVREFKAAVAAGDVARLSSISGIGRKTAERIVVELRDRLSAGEALEAVAGEKAAGEEDHRIRDAVTALVSLGYRQADSRRMVMQALRQADAGENVEDIVRRALTGR